MLGLGRHAPIMYFFSELELLGTGTVYLMHTFGARLGVAFIDVEGAVAPMLRSKLLRRSLWRQWPLTEQGKSCYISHGHIA